MILIVSYDLDAATNHAPLFEALKQQGTWWHYLTSTWLISTTKTPEQVYNALVPSMVQSDRILVFELGKAYNGWLPREAWDWIQQQQTRELSGGSGSTGLARFSPFPPPPPGIFSSTQKK